MSKFAIDPGHGCPPDTGAVGYLNEQNCVLDIANKVISKLQAIGNEAWNVRPSSASSVTDSLQKRCDGASNADYLISIHLNSGGGKGTEIFAASKEGNRLAADVLKYLVTLGFANRGVKDGSWLYVIKHSKPTAILIEVCFVDNQSDAELYKKLGAETIANAIVQGLTGQIVKTASDNNSSTQSSNSDFIKSVQHDLQRLNCLPLGENFATGQLDSKTKEAIRQFRSIVGLPDKTNIDNTLIDALNAIVKKPIIGKGWPANTIATKYIQWWLGLPKTGIFDDSTEKKAKIWQKAAKVYWDPDGVIRAESWDKILK